VGTDDWSENPINQTRFSIAIDTVLPELPESQGTDVGNPDAGGGSDSANNAAAVGAFLALAFSGENADVLDTYVAPLRALAKQREVNAQKEMETFGPVVCYGVEDR